MNGRFGKEPGRGDKLWSDFGSGQQTWEEFGGEGSNETAGFGYYEPHKGRGILKTAVVIVSISIAIGGIAAILWLPIFREKSQKDSVNMSHGVQEIEEVNRTDKTENLPGDPEQKESAGKSAKESQDQNLPEEIIEKQEDPHVKDYSYAHGYYYSFLTEEEAKAYDALTEACENLASKAEVSLESEVQELNVLDAFVYDHPEYYWVYQRSTYTYDQTGHISQIGITIPDDVQSVIHRLDSEAESVMREVQNIEDIYERYKWIYNYIIDSTEYGQAEGVDDQSVTGVLLDHLAVCNGYSSAFKFLCDKCGLDCIKVTGDALSTDASLRGAHAWNMVFIEEVPYWVDVTWGDPQFESEDHWDEDWKDYSYLCATDELFMKKHRIDDTLGREKEYPEHFHAFYPSCTDTRYDYFRMMGVYFDSAKEAEEYIHRNVSGSVPYLEMRFRTREEQEKVIEDLQEGRIWHLVEEEGTSFSQLQFFYDEALYTLFIEFR